MRRKRRPGRGDDILFNIVIAGLVGTLFFLAIGIMFSDAEGASYNWRVQMQLGGTKDSAHFQWYTGNIFQAQVDDIDNNDSLDFSVIALDQQCQYMWAHVWWQGYDSAHSQFFTPGHGFQASGDSVWWHLRPRWPEPPDSVELNWWVDGSIHSTIDYTSPMYSLDDSLKFPDTEKVHITWTEWYGSEPSGAAVYFPIGHTDTTVVYDTLTVYDTVFSIGGSASPLSTVFLSYNRDGSPQKGAVLVLQNENVATDSTLDVILGPIYKFDITDSTGVAQVQIPRSYIFHDSTKGLYNAVLRFRGRVVKHWPDLWVPDADTFRIIVSQ